MKVRISRNSIRFRLKEPEVKRFQQEGVISEVLEFGNNETEQLKFSLSQCQSDEINVQFQSNETTIFVPQTIAKDWTSTDLVGFEAEVNTGKGKIIFILVEKDFTCMDGREEDETGSYPNPLLNIENTVVRLK